MKKLLPILILFCGCEQIKFLSEIYPDDNPIEEAVEEVIKEETGIDLDLSFTTPENVKSSDN